MLVLRRTPLLSLALAAAACAGRGPAAPVPRAEALVPHRVVDTEAGQAIAFADLVERVAAADVVFFGEQHDDAGTHRLQHALLEALAQRGRDVVLSLEMFERDVQTLLDRYLMGDVSEAEFLAGARPWPNYPSDYRPLVELAAAHGWPVVAANVPRRIAAAVARGGLDTLDALPAQERAWAARELSCPRDAYYERFLVAMGMHPGADGTNGATDRYYEAQCIKDETMAESIAAALAAHPGALVVHVTGAFHSDFGDGIPARLRRRVPGARIVVLTGIPVRDPEGAPAPAEAGRADYLIFTQQDAGAAARAAEAPRHVTDTTQERT